MDDREMLELAARAAGYDVVWNEQWKCFQHKKPIIVCGQERHVWIPKDDDGDALRLAVNLRLDVNIGDGNSCASIPPHAPWEHESPVEPHGTDPYAATRLAIFRAAAEIGRRMSEASGVKE